MEPVQSFLDPEEDEKPVHGLADEDSTNHTKDLDFLEDSFSGENGLDDDLADNPGVAVPLVDEPIDEMILEEDAINFLSADENLGFLELFFTEGRIPGLE